MLIGVRFDVCKMSQVWISGYAKNYYMTLLAPSATMAALYSTERTAPGRSVRTEHYFPFTLHSLSGRTVLNLTTQFEVIQAQEHNSFELGRIVVESLS